MSQTRDNTIFHVEMIPKSPDFAKLEEMAETIVDEEVTNPRRGHFIKLSPAQLADLRTLVDRERQRRGLPERVRTLSPEKQAVVNELAELGVHLV